MASQSISLCFLLVRFCPGPSSLPPTCASSHVNSHSSPVSNSKGKLSLQRLWFYVQPSMRTMETLEMLTVELKDVKGGEMLKRLKTLSSTGGDEASRQLHIFLLQQVTFGLHRVCCRSKDQTDTAPPFRCVAHAKLVNDKYIVTHEPFVSEKKA